MLLTELNFMLFLIYQDCQTSKSGRLRLYKFSSPSLWLEEASSPWPLTTNSKIMSSEIPSLCALETVWHPFLQVCTFSRLFWRFPWANELSKSFYWHFSIAICLYSHEVSGKIIFPDTFPKTYLNSTCTCHFLHHKVSGKYISGKIFPDNCKSVWQLGKNSHLGLISDQNGLSIEC